MSTLICLVMIMKSTNPLRYPGGKYYLAEYVSKVLDYNCIENCIFFEPYAGSAAVSLELLYQRKVKEIVIIEKDPLIYAFWKSVIDYTNELCEEIEKLEISLNTWYEFAPYKKASTPLQFPLVKLGTAGLFYNRTNYSGILTANPLGGKKQTSKYKIDCRFNKKTIINHILKIANYSSQITVKWSDALKFLKEHLKVLNQKKSFVYIDPPYYEKGKSLYRYYYKDNDHKDLADFIKKCRFPWLISYDDHPFINNLYFGQNNNLNSQKLYCDYSAQKHKKGNEILISNLVIPPLENLKTNEIKTI